jgi:hypothetical protein
MRELLRRSGRGGLFVVLACALLLAVIALVGQREGEARVSEFGRYQGYSQPLYDGSRRTSDYLVLPGGNRLAYDLILPTRGGVPATERLPVLFKYTPYLRTFTIFDRDGKDLIGDLFELPWWQRAFLRLRYWTSDRGHLMDPLFRTKWLERLLRHGYVVVVVERSGTGASSGVADLSHQAAMREAGQILDWIAAQPWSNGRIGMYGESFQAMVQFAAAASGNPHLKAIFPASSGFDPYNVTFAGGVYNKGFQSFFTWSMAFLERVVTPVDADADGAQLARVIEERRGRTAAVQSTRFADFGFRDSLTPQGQRFWRGGEVYALLEGVNRANVPAYVTCGWYDIFTADAFLLYRNLTVPKRLTLRPIDHSKADDPAGDLDYGAEAHRWFDYWLKGIDNGIMREPPVHYYVMGAPKDAAWRASAGWPPAGMATARWHLREGKTGSIESANDGFLQMEAPATPGSGDAHTVDYTTTTGKGSRWRSINWPRDYPDMRANDRKALTYTTAPLASPMELAGHPVLRLWLASDAQDLDVFAYLEEVDGGGRSAYLTEGVLRASHRRQGAAPYDNLGLPYHTHAQRDAAPLPAGAAVELAFGLLPSSVRLPQGSRLRLTVAFADADNFDTPVLQPPPRVRVLREPAHASSLEIPLAR